MKLFILVIPFLIAALPLSPLIHLDRFYNTEYFIHLFPIAHIGRVLRATFTLPHVISSDSTVLYPIQVFYSYLFYPLAGLFAALTGSGELGIRAIAVPVFWAQAGLVFALFRRLTGSLPIATAMSAIVCWATYPMTCLYSRGALPEAIAITMASSALAAWFLLITEERRQARWFWAIVLGLMLGLVVGTHPITAIYSGIAFPLLMAATLPSFRLKERLAPLALAGALAAVLAAPFLYVQLRLARYLRIANFNSLLFFPEDIDHFLMRLAPLPMDRRSLLHGTQITSPYMDTQINMPLLFLALSLGALAFASRRRRDFLKELRSPRGALVACSAILLVVFYVMSVSLRPYDFLPNRLQVLQFPYRLISFQNLATLALVVGLLRAFPLSTIKTRAGLARDALIAATAACLALSFSGFFIKYLHVRAVGAKKELAVKGDPEGPPAIYVFNHFNTLNFKKLGSKPEKRVSFKVDSSGRVLPAHIELASPQVVATNTYAFDWNGFWLDGSRVPRDRIFIDGENLAVELPSGRHSLEARSEPDPIWRILLFAALAAVFLAVGVLPAQWRRTRE